jgi:putative oxidoreductase
VKSIELLCAIAFLAGRFLPLAVLALLPVSINILLVHTFLAPEGLPVAIFVIAGNIFLAFACRKHYRDLLAAKARI